MKVTTKNLEKAKALYEKAKAAYYNKKEIMSDQEFDTLEDQIKALDPKWKALKKTGVKPQNKKTEVRLHEFMPSLNKMYPEAVEKFYATRAVAYTTRWLVMDKLDGTSLQLAYKEGRPFSLYTRGDGEIGKDVSYLLPSILEHGLVPDYIPVRVGLIVLRLEGVMSDRTFSRKWSREAAGEDGADNARQLVNGMFNRQKPHPALADVSLVVLGVYGLTMSEGLQMADDWGFDIVTCSIEKGTTSAERLAKMLENRRRESKYLMDGLVLCPTRMPLKYDSNDKPKGIVAFKVNDEQGASEVVVEDVLWQKTRLKRWIPKIQIKPTKMDGVMVTHATLHNAAWCAERKIGPGSILKVLRSGGVIPKVVDVVKGSKFKAPPGAYELQGRHFVVADHDDDSRVKEIQFFLTTLDIEFLAEKSVRTLLEVLPSLMAYLRLVHLVGSGLTSEALKTLASGGLGDAMSRKVVQQLKTKLVDQKIGIRTLMVASGCFTSGGIGDRKLKAMEEGGLSCADALYMSSKDLVAELCQIKGFQAKTAQQVADGMKSYARFHKQASKYIEIDMKAQKKAAPTTGPLKGLLVSWTGYRDKQQEALVTRLGGQVVSFSAKTQVLLYREGGKASSKIDKAGERAMTWPQFVKAYRIKE